ncbi:hypothetical protein [Shewanella gelidii]|uniref:Uncharacterized protein n=1 Tax=Shewanella gelidii TaxID=1642821 RepID=A0A917JNL7_9GAMM|nr:hypothetical protein [Shewanella gelidii]MCL1099462.1 hypothetical protein [Shewanella gelidii]GGI77201.1 hypothetical protein GCM10009332_13130 [Shewanella gelidii]
MEVLFTLAAVLAFASAVVHATYGRAQYLVPVLHSQIEIQSRSVLQFTFYSLFVFMLLSGLVFIACACEVVATMHSYGLVLFIAMNYGLLGIWQLFLWRTNQSTHNYIGQYYWVICFAIAGMSCGALFV